MTNSLFSGLVSISSSCYRGNNEKLKLLQNDWFVLWEYLRVYTNCFSYNLQVQLCFIELLLYLHIFLSWIIPSSSHPLSSSFLFHFLFGGFLNSLLILHTHEHTHTHSLSLSFPYPSYSSFYHSYFEKKNKALKKTLYLEIHCNSLIVMIKFFHYMVKMVLNHLN